MVRKRTPRSRANRAETAGGIEADFDAMPPSQQATRRPPVETTGRFIIVFKEGARDPKKVQTELRELAGLKTLVASSDYNDGAVAAEDVDGKPAHFERLGVVVVSEPEAVQALAASASDADSPILVVEPEYINYLATAAPPWEYLRGYRDAVVQLYDQLAGQPATAAAATQPMAAFQDTDQFTWGLQAVRADTSKFSGQGIKVAVLDTGFDLQHPDYLGRAIVAQQFTGVPVQDVHGHGTHCIGTSCGSQRPATGVRRYGVAFGAQIFAGKVFNNAPRPQAPTGAVIAGLEWAITNGCRVASLSLGAPINQKIMQYEVPMQRALAAGTLIVAAAGNNANRQGLPGFDSSLPATDGFVEPPGNADASLAVAAVDSRLRIAAFSARSSVVTGEGGKVNVAGPGVDVFSSVPVARGNHLVFSGTSMATPHAAGVAALWAQATGDAGSALWNRVAQACRPLNLASADVGAGLVQAPQ